MDAKLIGLEKENPRQITANLDVHAMFNMQCAFPVHVQTLHNVR